MPHVGGKVWLPTGGKGPAFVEKSRELRRDSFPIEKLASAGNRAIGRRKGLRPHRTLKTDPLIFLPGTSWPNFGSGAALVNAAATGHFCQQALQTWVVWTVVNTRWISKTY